MLRKRPSKKEYLYESWGVVPKVGQELGALMPAKITKNYKNLQVL